MKVSVVITTFNLSQFIAQCIESVLGQTYLPYEIIIADDCSSDNTLEIIKSLCSAVVVVRQHENRGALLNTLAGLNYATGDIVAFIDGDDTWPAHKLQRVVAEFSADESVFLVTHAHRRVNSVGIPTGQQDETHNNIERIFLNQDPAIRNAMLRRSVLMREGIWFGSAYSIRRSKINLIRFNSLVFDLPESRDSYLDLVLAPFIVANNSHGKVVCLPDVIFDYRIHLNNSAASNTIEKQFRALKRVRATNFVTRHCLLASSTDDSVVENFGFILLEYDYLEALYSKKNKVALIYAFHLAKFFIKKKILLKEISRVILVIVFGPRIFLSSK